MANKDYLPREEFRKTNVIGTKRLIESLEECEVKQFIQISTVGVYGSTGLEPVNEESGYGEKLSDYEWSKMEAEKKALECCQKLGIPLTILRLGLVYGENMAYGWPQMIDNVVKGRMRIIGKGNNRIQLSYIRDIVEGITRVIGNKRSCGVTLNLCGAQIYRIENIFYTIADILKVSRPPKVPFFPVYLLSGILKLIPESFKPKSIKLLTPHRVRFFKDNRVYNIKKAKEIMNFYPKYDLEEGMANTIKAHKEECYGK